MSDNKEQGSYQLHQERLKDFQLAAGMSFDDVIVIPYAIGMFRDFETAERIIHAGVPGVPDTIVFGRGWYCFFDVKTGNATWNENQLRFKARMKVINGREMCFKFKNVVDAINIIKEMRRQYNE